MHLQQLLQGRFRTALTGLVEDPAPYLEMVKPSKDGRFGDYQANLAMPLAKVLSKKPQEVAKEVIGRLDLGDVLEQPEIAGPGFINLRFKKDWLAKQAHALTKDERLGVAETADPETVVIDYSSPNVAKPMHVGHLRSTIIGDSLARLFRFLGHKVVSDNHLGDWGTQMGMLIHGYKHIRNDVALAEDPVAEMVRLYVVVRNVTKPVEEDEEEATPGKKPKYTPEEIAEAQRVLEACREETAKLHAGDPANVALWKQMMPWCLAELDRIYQRLDVHFDHTHGESFYNPMLPDVVASLRAKGIAEDSKGAVVIFFGEKDSPAIVQKRDGAFTYTTSDLATIRYRMDEYAPKLMLYVVDFRQSLHFKQLFAAAKRWGYDGVKLEHISFGSVLGQDGKPIKTREGGAIELGSLLDEAVQRAAVIVKENSPELDAQAQRQVAEAVGLGAVKYADLSQNRESNYVFSWDKMLAMNGNTATYMQYAYVRVRGIFRKANADAASLRADPPKLLLDTDAERGLALALLRFPEALDVAAAEYKPHVITGYLWDLANSYSTFFEHCPVNKAPTEELRQSRLLLCDLTARVLQQGLHLLGIRTIEQM